MSEYSNALLNKTIELWQPYYEKKLTVEDAREIIVNMVSLVKLLDHLEKKYEKKL